MMLWKRQRNKGMLRHVGTSHQHGGIIIHPLLQVQDCQELWSSTKMPLITDFYDVGAEKRFYHNYEHATTVAYSGFNIATSVGVNGDAIYIAGLWHDCVYVPGSKTNEDESADALLRCHPNKTKAASMIRRTTIKDHLESKIIFDEEPEMAILLDADILSLADRYDKFVINQMNILKEHDLLDPSISANFLQNFLDKQSIYRTPVVIATCEQKAKTNIARFIEEFK